MIPEGWKLRRLGEIATVTTGGTPSRKRPEYWDGSIPWIKTSSIDFCVIQQGDEFITEEGLHDSAAKLFPKNTILMAMYGQGMTRGRVAILGIDSTTNQACAAIQVKADVDHKYVYYYLASRYREIRELGHGGNQKNLNAVLIKDIRVAFPPLPEQRKITEILGTWDQAIALTEQRIEAARQRKKGLMQRLLTGRVRFPEFAGGKWQEVQLGNLAEVKRGASPRPIRDPKWFAESGRGWIRIADVTDSPTRFLNQTSQYLSPLGETKSVKVEIGELIMSICATIGVPKIVNIPACIHDGFVVFRGYEKHLSREFLYHYLNFITERLANRGQPGTQKNLNSSLVRKIRVPKPPLAEQEKIAAVLQSCDREIELLTQKRDALQRQKKGLMQWLLTGRVRVKV